MPLISELQLSVPQRVKNKLPHGVAARTYTGNPSCMGSLHVLTLLVVVPTSEFSLLLSIHLYHLLWKKMVLRKHGKTKPSSSGPSLCSGFSGVHDQEIKYEIVESIDFEQ